MNPLQSGTPASALTPQSYKNSSQNSSFQDTYSGSSIQQSASLSQSINTLPITGGLVVVDGGNSNVLGASTSESYSVTTGTTSIATTQNSNSFVSLAFIIFAVSLGLSVYFYKRYKKLAPVPVDEEE